MTDRNEPIHHIKAALPNADWAPFDRRVAEGFEFERTTVLAGKVYWWMHHRVSKHLALVASPLTGADAHILAQVIEHPEGALTAAVDGVQA